MRSFLAGLGFLFLMSVAAYGVPTGGVESIGFAEGIYRPDCNVPMVVNLSSDSADAEQFEIHVEQEDLDGDITVFKRPITLNGGARNARFWVYFVPRPRGLPDSGEKLHKALRVSLNRPDGTHVADLPLPSGQTLRNLDPAGGMGRRAKKLVVAVRDPNVAGRRPSWTEYQRSLGLLEEPELIEVRPSELPENHLGFEMIDAILWLPSAEAADLSLGGLKTEQALRQWIAQGGNFVVLQPTEFGRIEELADLLPIEYKHASGDYALQMQQRTTPDKLHSLVLKNQSGAPPLIDPWTLSKGPFTVARATARPGAFVEEWIDWQAPGSSDAKQPPKIEQQTPYIARMPYGSGSVTWVAEDLTSPALGDRLWGWPYIWDAVFGWKNKVFITQPGNDPTGTQQREQQRWETSNAADVGKSVLEGTDHTGKAGAYLLLAVFFFVAYWFLAGPGSFLFLASKKRRHLSWMAFAAAAIVATLLTVGVVRLVLRGSPELKHFTIVRIPSGQNAIVNSRMGVYIPRDGDQEIKITGVVADAPSQLHALTLHPQFVPEGRGFLDTDKYEVPVEDERTDGSMSVKVPSRSTLKKIQAQATIPAPPGASIQGEAPSVLPAKSSDKTGMIRGRLANNTGVDLEHVYFAFRFVESQTYLVHVPLWKNGTTLDLEKEYWAGTTQTGQTIDFGKPYSGQLHLSWARFWHSHFGGFGNNLGGISQVSDFERSNGRIFLALMSVFDAVPPQPNEGQSSSRVELYRRGGRDLDLSRALMAGQLIVMAEAPRSKLPLTLQVEGDAVDGEGLVYYQFIFPLTRDMRPPMEQLQPEQTPADQAPKPEVEKP